jgi:D-Tyr-tRNAtyr deacylase
MAKQQKMVVVAQRITSASLLVDNIDEWVTVGHGLIVYVSFYAACEVSHLPGIAKRILGAPLAVSAASVEDWDGRAGTAGGAAMSVVAAGIAGGDGNPSHVLVVPQACLVSKLKGTATKPKLQYHGAKRPAEAEALYDAFVAALRGEAAAIAAKAGGGEDTVVIKCGTFGNRQALKLECPGPFSHTLQF